jgi:hypothetical protein
MHCLERVYVTVLLLYAEGRGVNVTGEVNLYFRLTGSICPT